MYFRKQKLCETTLYFVIKMNILDYFAKLYV